MDKVIPHIHNGVGSPKIPDMPTRDEKDALDGTGTPSSSNKYVTADYNCLVPTGAIVAYPADTAPSGWLLCDGSAVSRTTYADLFDKCSVRFGSGDGSTTFNVPNLKGRFNVGKDGSTFNAVGDTGGAETHTLTTSEIPAHGHNLETADNSAGNEGPGVYDSANNKLGRIADADATPDSLADCITGGGSGDAHENLPPYLVVNYIIKT